MRAELAGMLCTLLWSQPVCRAQITGSSEYPNLQGEVSFFPFWNGTLVAAELWGLPAGEGDCGGKVFGFHIHEGRSCTGTKTDPFADALGHYNPDGCVHPQHAGDFPPLFEQDGYALTIFYTGRFEPEEVEGRCVIVHGMPDDFRTQPSGDSGMKIACGQILPYREETQNHS